MARENKAIDEWKTKYFDQLERLEKREANWEQLETTLKRAIGRLSIAAEGQHEGLDGHLASLRSSIKRNVSQQKLEPIIDDISTILAQLEEKKSGPNRAITGALALLISNLQLPDSQQKSCKKIIKKLEKSDDNQWEKVLSDSVGFLNSVISPDDDQGKSRPGFLSRVLSTTSNGDDQPQPPENKSEQVGSTLDTGSIDIGPLVRTLHKFFAQLPWPADEKQKFDAELARILAVTTLGQLQEAIHQMAIVASEWTGKKTNTERTFRFAVYKDCLIDLIEALDDGDEAQNFATLKTSVQLADEEGALDELMHQLSNLLLQSQAGELEDSVKNGRGALPGGSSLSAASSLSATSSLSTGGSLRTASSGEDDSLQPTIQELLIRLLEQLIVPKNLEEDAERLKHNLENKANSADWRQLLKDVANLINSIRLSIQAEKNDFEGFLQQVTDRLKDMDLFLLSETTKLASSQDDGRQFDQDIQTNVNTIRDDVHQATELPQLKVLVDNKLEKISEHINAYREAEKKRAEESQENVESMHERMQALEKETESLKKVIVEKNQQAMFDTLTNVPNRLFYEQRIEEEYARWQRSQHAFTLAIWDIDLFKNINDSYGHKAGDKVLATIAQLLNKGIRKSDFFARYGGEEFVMLLPETTGPDALTRADALREKIKACSFHYRGEDVRITVSCGLSSFRKGDAIEDVFERADQALYEAKDQGRNLCLLDAE
ncbi:hypothetical protein A9Q90_05335 [Gammaproteobacteria bacterium 54_18_T64]|nr:hypothetical protein A9Q90_05335 [Gammaproteobacteria bacterium 54_18_T64]